MACYGRPFLSICLINSQVKHFLYPFFFSFFFFFFSFFFTYSVYKSFIKRRRATPSIKPAVGEQLQAFGASLPSFFLPLSSSLHHVSPAHVSFEVLIFLCDTFLSRCLASPSSELLL
jgi:hypothetical protein